MTQAVRLGLMGAAIGALLGLSRTGCVVDGETISFGVGVPIVGGSGIYAVNVLINALIGYLIGSIVGRRQNRS